VEKNRQEQHEALFERLAELDHPSIAPIYDSGLEENSFYYTSASYNGDNLVKQMLIPSRLRSL